MLTWLLGGVAAIALWTVLLLADGLRVAGLRSRAQARRRRARTPIPLMVIDRIDHTPELFTLVLAHPRRRRLPGYLPGQYLTVCGPDGEYTSLLSRRYSLSSWEARPRTYRLGIRRVVGGRMSEWLHAHAQPERVIDVLPPAGDFVLQSTAEEVVLVGAGIGLTPLAAMLDALWQRRDKPSGVWLYHCAREELELLDHDCYLMLDGRSGWFHYRPFLTRPTPAWSGRRGRLSARDLIGELSAPDRAAFYLCARPEMMAALAAELTALGIPQSAIFYESFGSAASNRDTADYKVGIAGHGDYTFQGEPTLLHALESWGVPIEAECRAGECGACRLKLVSGEIRECCKPLARVPVGEVLACCCVPASELTVQVLVPG